MPERYVGDVAEGQHVDLSVAAYPGETFAGDGRADQPRGRPGQPDLRGRGRGPQPGRPLRPGSFAKARIVTRREDDATLVPIESVVRFAGVVKLFLFEPDPAPARAGASPAR